MTVTKPENRRLVPPAAAAPAARRRWWADRSPAGKFWLAVAPALIVYGVFTVYPMGQVIVSSFTDARGFNRPVNFVGLENFARIFSGDTVLLQAIGNTAIYGFFKVIVQTVLAFLIAVLLHRRLLLGNVYRSIFFAPMVISPVAIVFTWSFMYDPTTGTINTTLRSLGLDHLAQDWLGSYDLALYSVILVDLWSGLGFNIIIFLAGLSTIPGEIMEAAKVDGARAWTTLRYVTIPLMVPSIGLVLVLAINGALRAFDTVYLMTRGGPGNETQLYMTQVFHEGLVRNNFGYASAMAVLVIVVLIAIAAAQNRLTKSTTAEGGAR
ncbi:carbohydrate ABC transporter permease [Jiangella rhizosphaerae]|uniref:Sugar ABC transporter permease n=1 Tax=Jiangella rhizosphaerae TaxID=2293569 RepID=A0A418KKR3_9ACTN|nr:sugar ABC transporter permease [Jiangella rhizosphaerae]RIQ17834.1 sugar ABC transporter permease [Jiangella rhizosphaerae]